MFVIARRLCILILIRESASVLVSPHTVSYCCIIFTVQYLYDTTGTVHRLTHAHRQQD
jgi:hypothetical protein